MFDQSFRRRNLSFGHHCCQPGSAPCRSPIGRHCVAYWSSPPCSSPQVFFGKNVILPTICNVSCDDRGNIAPVSFDTEHVSAVETLSQLKSLKVLRYLFDLDLSGTTITDAELVHLNGIPNLTCLNLQETTITDAGVTELQKALPNCYIFH